MVYPNSNSINNAVFLALFTLMFADVKTADVCHPQDQCSCKFDNGMEISLWPIDKKGSPRFKDIDDRLGETYKYSYNPCSPFTRTDLAGECKNVLGCQSGLVGGVPVAIAYPNKPVVKFDNKAKMYTFTYTGSQLDIQDVRKLIIQLKCEAKVEVPKVEEFLPIDANTYSTTLTTKYACPRAISNGLSIGSILCISLASLIVTYFIIGMMFNKFIKQKTGTDVIPQKQFWVGLPSLVKDGTIFTVRKVRRKDAEYEKL